MSMMSPQSVGAGLEEIELIYRRDLGKLQRLATAIVGNREAGCDAVQDAFARAVHRRGQFRREGSLEGWLWRIVVTTARDAAARVPSTQLSVERERGIDSDALVDDGEDAALRRMILRLPERQRHVLFLRYYGDLDYSAIADTLEISAGTVAATLSQARGNLKRLLMEVPR
jgi:RNA polymerase sigma-70 factor (ECF subfamily)